MPGIRQRIVEACAGAVVGDGRRSSGFVGDHSRGMHLVTASAVRGRPGAMSSFHIHHQLVRDAGAIERCERLALTPDLRELLVRAHGPSATDRFALPEDYASFLRNHGGGLCTLRADGTVDPFGWFVFRASHALASTEGGYRLFLDAEDAPDDELRDALSNLEESGIWLCVGRARDRHEHYLCCDRDRPAFGRVYDLNDGHPACGLVYDGTWPSFSAYIAPPS